MDGDEAERETSPARFCKSLKILQDSESMLGIIDADCGNKLGSAYFKSVLATNAPH